MKTETTNFDSGKIYIPTIDPKCGGGVGTVTEFTKQTFENENCRPKVIYNSIDWEKGRTIKDLFVGRTSVPVYQREDGFISEIEVGRILPESEVLGYLLNFYEWGQLLDGSNPILGVGGTCLPCFPVAVHGYDYDCWIGTTLVDERKYQVTHWPTTHHIRYVFERPLLERMERYVLERADTVYAQSSYTKKIVEEKYDIPSKSIAIVPFPIDINHYSPPNHRDFSKDIVFVGRINDPRKRVDILIKAFSLLLERHTNARLYLVGETPNDNIHSLIASLGIESNVETPGRVNNLLDSFHNAAVFALSSDQEGLGIAGLEAMSTGLPVVSTKCGGPEDYVIDGWNGRMVPKESPTALAEALDDVLSNPDTLYQMGKNGRNMIVEKYNQKKVRRTLLEKILG